MILDRPKKEVENLDTVLFGKYQLCRILGTGRVGTVFLAVHQGLSEYRAIKRVPKSFLDYERFRREALILKELRHPGIPIVYDVEEDETYSYLIEEYLEGESLYDLVVYQGHLSREQTICYGMQLTRIVSYLHLAGPNPILHLDLQPKNLLLCHGTIKLIDFDHAAFSNDIKSGEARYGTVGCAAPEQYNQDEILDERTDLYAIGVILHYLYTGQYPPTPFSPVTSMEPELTQIIRTCLETDRRERFSSAQELCERLAQLAGMGTAVLGSHQLSSLTIALTGSKSGAGTTHVAIGLSVHLRNLGFFNLYEEKNGSGMGAALGAYTGVVRDRYGLMQYHGFVWKPMYGAGVKLPPPPAGPCIVDYGADVESALASGADVVILVCDGKNWSLSAAAIAAEKVVESHMSYALVYNHVAGGGYRLPKGVERGVCFRAPYYPDPWKENTVSAEFYRSLLLAALKDVPGGCAQLTVKKNKAVYLWKKGNAWLQRKKDCFAGWDAGKQKKDSGSSE